MRARVYRQSDARRVLIYDSPPTCRHRQGGVLRRTCDSGESAVRLAVVGATVARISDGISKLDIPRARYARAQSVCASLIP